VFGPLGRASAPKIWHSRRRLRLLVALGLLVALLVGELVNFVVASYGPNDRRAEQSWVAAVAPIVAASDGQAPLVAALTSDPAALSAAVLRTDLGALTTESAAELTELSAVVLPSPTRVGDRLQSALAARSQGVAVLSQAFATSAGLARAPASATSELARAMTLFDAGDAGLASVRRLLGANLARHFPTGRWHPATKRWPSPSTLLAGLPQFVGRAKLTFLALSLEPAPTAYSGLPALTTTTTTTTSTTTTTTLVPGASTTTTLFPTTTTTTSLAPGQASTTTTTLASLPVAYPQIPPAGALSTLLPTTTLRVVVVVANPSATAVPVSVTAQLVRRGPPAGASASVEFALGTLAPDSSRYARLPQLSVASGVNRFELRVSASAPGLAGTTVSVALAISH
jgi:hypothetical protein